MLEGKVKTVIEEEESEIMTSEKKVQSREKYERLASLTESLKYLMCDAIDTINALGCGLAKTSKLPCLYCEYNNLDKCMDCNFSWSEQAKSEKIIDEIEREDEK